MSGLLIGAIVVAAVFALIAIKAVFAVGPLLDENEALKRYERILEQRAEETARQTGWKLTHLECRLERQTEITNAAFRRERDLYNRLAKHEGCDVERDHDDDPDYFDYLDSLEAERDARRFELMRLNDRGDPADEAWAEVLSAHETKVSSS